jgi:hypothetical protein
LLVAAILQFWLFEIGLLRVSADESAKALMSMQLSWHNAFEPGVWPPFYKIFVGLMLRISDDPFIIPRIVSSVTAILVIVALVFLSNALFGDWRIDVLTGALSVLVPHRLLLGVAPLSDIYYFLFVIGAGIFILAWLRGSGAAALLAGCACVMLAETVRFEACFFAAVLGPVLAWQWLQQGKPNIFLGVVACILLFAFPVFWIADTYLWFGTLDPLALTSQQFITTFGHAYGKAARWNPMVRPLALDFLSTPLMLAGLATLALVAWRDRTIRLWAVVFGVPLPVISVVMVISLSIPMTATWRTSGAWALLLVPFTAAGVLRGAAFLWPNGVPRWAAVAALLLAVVPVSIRDARYIREGMYNANIRGWRQDHEVGQYAVAALRKKGEGKILVDSSDNLDYLDVIAESGAPELFLDTARADPLEVAHYAPSMPDTPPPTDPAIVEQYLTDKFGLADGGAADALLGDNIRIIVARNPAFIAGLNASQAVRRERTFAGWVVYCVRRSALVAKHGS